MSEVEWQGIETRNISTSHRERLLKVSRENARTWTGVSLIGAGTTAFVAASVIYESLESGAFRGGEILMSTVLGACALGTGVVFGRSRGYENTANQLEVDIATLQDAAQSFQSTPIESGT